MTVYVDEMSTGPAVFAQAAGDAKVNGFNAGLAGKPKGSDCYGPAHILHSFYTYTPAQQAYGNELGYAAVNHPAQVTGKETRTKFADEYEQWGPKAGRPDISRVTFYPVVGQEQNIQSMNTAAMLVHTKDPKFGPLPSTAQIIANVTKQAAPVGSSEDAILAIIMGY